MVELVPGIGSGGVPIGLVVELIIGFGGDGVQLGEIAWSVCHGEGILHAIAERESRARLLELPPALTALE